MQVFIRKGDNRCCHCCLNTSGLDRWIDSCASLAWPVPDWDGTTILVVFMATKTQGIGLIATTVLIPWSLQQKVVIGAMWSPRIAILPILWHGTISHKGR